MIGGIRRIIAFGAVAASLSLGCRTGPSFEGKWSGERAIQGQPGADPAVLKTLSKLEIEFRSDGRFQMTDAGMGKSGSYRYGDLAGKPAAFLRVDSILGRPLSEQPESVQRSHEKEAEAVLQPDGTLAYHDPAGFDRETIFLHRASQPGP